ncbi:winged helix-turn-helix transcriptional regulator [Pseudomonas sp. NA-150]|uniref:winged helix-turn-helix transcriptional regulator n=1 Tax=Pseudomonas sp. NA-150 TaxID=3367525 RepID=UPI0037CB2EC1
MSWNDVSDSVNPIARSLAIFGDRWTLLIMFELAMGMHRFDEIQAQTGMSSYLLSSRLKRLEKDGLITRCPYSERATRFDYHPTPKGKELDPLLMMLCFWGMKWCGYGPEDETATKLVYKPTGETVSEHWLHTSSEKPLTYDDCDCTLNEAFQSERSAKRQAFRASKRNGH